MLKSTKVFGAALLLFAPTAGYAADLYEPPIIEAPEPLPPIIEPAAPEFGGWYIRGDVDYHWSKLRGTEYITYRYLRADLTADYWFKSDFNGSTSGTCSGGVPCVSTDTSAYSAWLLMANAYIDLGTYHGVTPYVGAGIGGAHIKWDDLTNTTPDGTTVHEGSSNWRFAYSLMAGASYCLTENLSSVATPTAPRLRWSPTTRRPSSRRSTSKTCSSDSLHSSKPPGPNAGRFCFAQPLS